MPVSTANAVVCPLSTRRGIVRKLFAAKAVRSDIGVSIGTLRFVRLLFHALVPAAVKKSLITKGTTANTAHTNATLPFGMGGVGMVSMSKNEVSYLVTMLLFRKMVDASILSQEEYDTINTQMKQKYDPKIGTLFAEITKIRNACNKMTV